MYQKYHIGGNIYIEDIIGLDNETTVEDIVKCTNVIAHGKVPEGRAFDCSPTYFNTWGYWFSSIFRPKQPGKPHGRPFDGIIYMEDLRVHQGSIVTLGAFKRRMSDIRTIFVPTFGNMGFPVQVALTGSDKLDEAGRLQVARTCTGFRVLCTNADRLLSMAGNGPDFEVFGGISEGQDLYSYLRNQTSIFVSLEQALNAPNTPKIEELWPVIINVLTENEEKRHRP